MELSDVNEFIRHAPGGPERAFKCRRDHEITCYKNTLLFRGKYFYLLHKTSFGRIVTGMGFNKTTCEYSGIKVNRVTMIVFTLAGLMAGVTAIFLSSRMGSTRPNVAMGYELEVIAMVVLGGVSTSGGIGRIAGPILAVFIFGYLSYGMGLANMQAPIVLVVIGLLLILSVLAIKVRFSISRKKSAV